ncbi:hypothetical protein B4064_1252 [Caldibacillus thermoamylovorans]|uniref:Uncharacterized protein n=1 Tax=Caldibacillus thermoamylovorans TaxID=35841 RepID=A0A0D0FRW8_9BACI|nr:hypothetical protein B4065_1812 [Caldibacillus thermoamylovorans]KIO69407.1 hypothetical protein B4064_1252 [Caldibacillus thermoamylovorans]KIO73589.1 hypothetical protein B4167_0007 [Caldibacillus thermoamylovorans]
MKKPGCCPVFKIFTERIFHPIFVIHLSRLKAGNAVSR